MPSQYSILAPTYGLAFVRIKMSQEPSAQAHRGVMEASLLVRTAETAVGTSILNLKCIIESITFTEEQGDHRHLRKLLYDRDHEATALDAWESRRLTAKHDSSKHSPSWLLVGYCLTKSSS